MAWGTPWHRRFEETAVNNGRGTHHPPITALNHQAEKPGIEEKTASNVPPATLFLISFMVHINRMNFFYLSIRFPSFFY